MKANLRPTIDDANKLKPAFMPPKFALLDIFPFSLLLKMVTRERRVALEGKKAAKQRAKSAIVTKNVPLEILTYLVRVSFSN